MNYNEHLVINGSTNKEEAPLIYAIKSMEKLRKNPHKRGK